MNNSAVPKVESSKHILLVEDSKDIQMILARVLKTAGYRVTCAENGKQALEILRSSVMNPGLILLDLMMPEMDGFEFRKQQEMDPRIATIPVIAMTAFGDVQSKAMQLGARAYLKKPFANIATILSTIEQHINK